MTVIRNNSISGINSITAQSSALNFYDSTGNTLAISADVTGGVTVATGATISGSTNTITASTNGVERVRIDSSGRILQGTTSYKSNLNSSADASGQLAQFVGKADNTNHCLGIFAYSGTSNPTARGAKLQLHRSRSTDGTTNTPVAVNDLIGSIEFKGNDATSFTPSARIDAYVDSGTVNTDRVPGSLRFYTSADAVGVPQERLRITSTGNVQIANGNLVLSTSGTGIDFSAATGSSAGSTSALLDDYEEGTWTPGLGGTGTITAGTAEGIYTKIGNICIARLRIDNATFGGSPNTEVTGLPFTAQQRSTTTDVVIANSFSVTHPQGLVIQNQTYISFGINPTNGSGFWSGATISTGTTKYIYCTLIYTVS